MILVNILLELHEDSTSLTSTDSIRKYTFMVIHLVNNNEIWVCWVSAFLIQSRVATSFVQ